jgi:hypothetical protein
MSKNVKINLIVNCSLSNFKPYNCRSLDKMAFEVQIADPIADAAEISRLMGLGFRTVYPFKDIFQDTKEDEYYKWSLGFASQRLMAPASVVFKTVELSTK